MKILRIFLLLIYLTFSSCITRRTKPDERCQFGALPDTLMFLDTEIDEFWQISSPIEQGLDAELIAEGTATLKGYPALYSLLIIRNGQIVVEKYFNGQTKNHSHEIASASKSTMSALTGIAIEQGYLEDGDQTLGEVLPNQFSGNRYPDKAGITLKGLMTMQTGFAWEPAISGGKSSKQAVSISAILDTPLSATETPFQYNTGATHVMSAIIDEATGTDTCSFAYRHLFDPLGIDVDWWNQGQDGHYTGGWNMYLTPRELARFGLLYLNRGQWQGEQMIYLIPELDLMMVTTSDATYQGREGQFDSLTFLWEYVLPAAAFGTP